MLKWLNCNADQLLESMDHAHSSYPDDFSADLVGSSKTYAELNSFTDLAPWQWKRMKTLDASTALVMP